MKYDDPTADIFAKKYSELAKNCAKTIPIAIFLLVAPPPAARASEAETSSPETSYELKQPASVGQVQSVRVDLEVRGELRLNPDGSKISTIPLSVNGDMAYEEKLIDVRADPWSRRSVRYYGRAEAKIKVGEQLLAPTLPQDWHTVCAQVDSGGSLIYSPRGPLTREQLDLIDVPGNSLLLPRLLPEKPVRIGDRWDVDPNVLARLLGLDLLVESDITCSLDDVEDQTAIVGISGEVEGAVGGVSSKIRFRARSNYDLSQHLITWFAVAMREKRAIGHAEPGFEVTARLRVAIAPLATAERLTDDYLRDLPLEAKPGGELLSFRTKTGRFQLIHDRRWRAMLDRRDLCVFRLVDRGDLIAQCNISELPQAEPGKQMSLESFRADVQRSLGDSFRRIVEASKSTTEDGKCVLRVLVAGVESEIPIQWIYYHISNDRGRRAAIAFTLEAKLAERFANADRTLIETFQFTDQPQPESPLGSSRRNTATTSSTGTTKS